MTAFFQRVGFAFKCFFLVLFAGRLPDELPERYLRGPSRRAAKGDAAVSAVESPPTKSPGHPSPAPPGARASTPAPATAKPSADAAEFEHPADAGTDRAVQVLALLQRDGRLVDFLYEDIAGYPDDQVGAAVREVHARCRDVLRRYLTVEPLLDGDEGRPALVQAGFDPGEVKLVGNLAGRPPYHGVIRHRGWRAAKVELPALPEGGGRSVIAPAEVEVE